MELEDIETMSDIPSPIDENKYLVFLNGTEKTSEIGKITDTASVIEVQFKGQPKVYRYNNDKVVIKKLQRTLDPTSVRLWLGRRCLFNVEKVLDFGEFIKVVFSNQKRSLYKRGELRIETNTLKENNGSTEVLNYLKELASSMGNHNIKGEKNDFLENQYAKMEFISQDSALSTYLTQGSSKPLQAPETIIFPFGLNLSQEKAVTRALANQISLIEGPPGTGKTQTILNIIANLLLRDKTIAVVSNNNAATQNVFDKLENHGLCFFVAKLGNKVNQKEFFENQISTYPKLEAKDQPIKPTNKKSLKSRIANLRRMLGEHNDLAKALMELEAIKIEKQHFNKIFRAQLTGAFAAEVSYKLDIEKILSFRSGLEIFQNQNLFKRFLFKVKTLFTYRVQLFGISSNAINDLKLILEERFYELKVKTLKALISSLEERLRDFQFESVLKQYTDESMQLFKQHLLKKYPSKQHRKQFDQTALWKNFDDFSEEFPVVLSTTHSLRNSTQESFLYDYLIIDEASQVDLVSGALAMSCAKNVVIVGDLKQLPHVVTDRDRELVDFVFNQYSLNSNYHYSLSLLASASKIFQKAPKTLLREHYRCHPKIIDFCNQKFYGGELIILSKANNIEKPMVCIKTAQGNHARGLSNQRQIDVVKNEILPRLTATDLGIVSPFREQVNKLTKHIDTETGVEIDTVHKYQGREKDTMIITTVVNNENEFADDPNLLNVAISRAKEQLYVVVSDGEKNKNMKDLVDYIRYNNFEVTESKIYSIFDLLYQNYSQHLKRYIENAKVISSYKSENLMNALIEEVISSERFSNLSQIPNYPLRSLIQDLSLLSENEAAFVKASSHIDFLIYSRVSKQPVLAIEVDGVAFHAHNPTQLRRDELKDSILSKFDIPILRFATDGSGEKEKLSNALIELTGNKDIKNKGMELT
ncbi:AAA domain-containing protein [Thiomicrorhabdus heinhorstiae]|uniref:AAA family ATPase n=1 Tax=Thiomicrorhabdus heinhorstiae TaxID=2748010 RepID=A0ABS0BVP1_9GAMM|nr:AAA domain-containing protein [Thiomicrorhabdus heinhorstiae]MBF6057429.1 AAA family ATPase [Thiomicrorhabdus heinhorstiae]